MNVVIMIPARFASTRFPGKPLVKLRGAKGHEKTLIERSVEAARRVRGVSGIFVVTDDERIAAASAHSRVGVIMTSQACRNGTERCAEALRQMHEPEIVVNLQGDALLTPPGFIEALIERMDLKPDISVATVAVRLRSEEVRELMTEEGEGRVGGTTVVTDNCGRALYFSKRLIPHLSPSALGADPSLMKLHIGVYAYRPDALRLYDATVPSDLEVVEGLEQLRFLAAGIPIEVIEVEPPAHHMRELNNPEDVAPIEEALAVAGLE